MGKGSFAQWIHTWHYHTHPIYSSKDQACGPHMALSHTHPIYSSKDQACGPHMALSHTHPIYSSKDQACGPHMALSHTHPIYSSKDQACGLQITHQKFMVEISKLIIYEFCPHKVKNFVANTIKLQHNFGHTKSKF